MSTISTTSNGSHRWMLAFRGIIAILFGVIILIDPGISLLALVYVFAAFTLIEGLASIAASFLYPRSRWALLVGGVLGIALGIAAFVWPHLTALVMLYLVALWIIFSGLALIGETLTVDVVRGHAWLPLIAGFIFCALGIVLLFRPVAGILSILWLLGVFFIAHGLLLLGRAFLPQRTSAVVE